MAKSKKPKKAPKSPKALKLVKPGSKKAPTAKRPSVASKGTSKGVKKSERQPALPTLEQARNVILEECTKSLADIRATIADARKDEAAEMQTALREMKKLAAKLGQESYAYKANGVELLLVPGDAKVRVRALKDGGDGQDDEDAPIVRETDDTDIDAIEEGHPAAGDYAIDEREAGAGDDDEFDG